VAGNDTDTKTLLHLDGTNGATSFPDVNLGGAAHTWSATGAATISTAQSKFGGASLRPSTSDGNLSTNYISTASSTDYDFGSGNFTVDFWVRYNSTGDAPTNGIGLFGRWGSAGSRLYNLSYYNGQYVFYWTTDGTNVINANFTTSISTGVWYHIAVVRNGTSLLVYVDGTALTNSGSSISTNTIYSTSVILTAGNQGGAASLNGWMDEFRVSKGIARWTTAFTPSTAPYGADYAVTASAGSYSLTGAIADLLTGFGYQLAADAGSYALSGAAATMTKAMRITAEAGSYALSGAAAIVAKAMHMTLAPGSYVLTGAAATMKKVMHLSLAAGSYALTFPASIISLHPGDGNAVRAARFVLQKLRTSDPTLEQ
jgi:hypothetical protein